MGDFRALCAELVEVLDELNCHFNIPSQSAIVERVHAALAEPEPAPAANREVTELTAEVRYLVREMRDQADHLSPSLELFGLIHRAADLLERQAAAAPVAMLPEDAQAIEPANRIILAPVPTPIPVSERLPGPEDCAGAGDCWWYSSFMSAWMIGDVEYGKRHRFRYWLPGHALPLPEVER